MFDKSLHIMEHWRLLFISAVSPVLGFLTPTRDFVFALILVFALNIWAGMRADGITIVRCRNFSGRKFKNALLELAMYLFIVEIIYTVMAWCGDREAAVVAVKSVTYVCIYVYLQNSFRNLVYAYPKRAALRVIYHIIRLEFARAMPSHVREVIERIERDGEGDGGAETSKTGKNDCNS